MPRNPATLQGSNPASRITATMVQPLRGCFPRGHRSPGCTRSYSPWAAARPVFARLLSCVSCLSWFLLGFAAFAQPVAVLDRIGTNSVSTDNNPGGFATHYAHGTANELWGTCGTVWTQPFNGTLAEAAFVGFARAVNATNGMLLDPVRNLSAFAMSVHLWTNGAAGFLAGTNSGHGDVVIPLGAGPAAPQLWGVTATTNSVVNSTNLYLSVLPTFRVATNLSALNLRLQAGREYVMALVFEGVSGNVVVRQSFATTIGAPDLLATYAGPGSLRAGPATNAFNRTQFATRITALPEAAVTLAIAQRTAGIELSWPPMAAPPELWTTTNLAGNQWSLWPEPVATNFLTITNTTGQQFFRLRMP